MHEIVATRIRYGYRRVHVMLKREGWQVGRNVVYRLYRAEGLVLRRKQPRRRKMVVHREARCRDRWQDRLRYAAGEDAKQILAQRATASDDDFFQGIRAQLGIA